MLRDNVVSCLFGHHSSHKLKKRRKKIKRVIIRLELPKVENILHESETGYCENCNKTVIAPVLDALPKSEFDLNDHLLVILLYVIGTPQRKTREILGWFGVYTSPASINNMIHRAQKYLGERKYKELEEKLKRSVSCGADETSYRYRGKTYYIWAVTNAKTVAYASIVDECITRIQTECNRLSSFSE